jgi:hypothetical protein
MATASMGCLLQYTWKLFLMASSLLPRTTLVYTVACRLSIVTHTHDNIFRSCIIFGLLVEYWSHLAMAKIINYAKMNELKRISYINNTF